MNSNYIYTPSYSIIDPPIETTEQQLPIEKLSWEDFEKLCLAIIQTDFSVNDCEVYGIKGQAQEGIDIFARQTNGKYRSYQCKRYEQFDVSNLSKAVEYFKEKEFYNKSEYLYLCTTCELNKTQLQNKFEELKAELLKDNITLIKWDKIQICRLLKDQPQIVFDFFGFQWVKKFNGELALKNLSKSKKKDAQQIAKFRTELYNFYSTIFNIQDPGIPIKELNSPYTLQERFIIPEILSNVKEERFETNRENYASKRAQNQYYYDNYWYDKSESNLNKQIFNNYNELEDNSIDIRLKVDEALIANNRNIIIGDPGAGKSTLLRYITLDILSPNPQLENISQKYGKSLPVWLPFAFVTKHLSKNDSLSIAEILKMWFNGFNKNYLFEIAEDALEDERLFLIIDGIDEWSSISSAHLAITRIETLRNLYDCKVLYSSRPYGFKTLKDTFTDINILNLAGFSNAQQRNFVEKWYGKWASLQEGNTNRQYVTTLTDNFIKELEQTGDLKKLAETPLLLSILIIQKMQDSVLPKNKLDALKEITQYLIKKHPVKRGNDAGIVQEDVIDIDFKEIFCELAINIQRESNDGVILKNDAQKVIEKYLITYAEYDKAKAKIYSQKLIEVGANNFGIIIEKSNDEIAFGHKQFQEFLAAQYLYESDDDSPNEFVKKNASDPSSHQVIISFFGLIPLKQVKKFKQYFDVLKGSCYENYQKEYLNLIAYEIAINLDNSPSDLMNKEFDSIVRDFEYETDPTYKEALLRRIINALNNVRLKGKVHNFLIQFFPNENKYKDYRISTIQNADKLNELQKEFLKKTFINGTIQLRYDTSYALRKHIKDDDVFIFVKDIIANCSNPYILAFAINCITSTDILQNERDELIASIEVDMPIVQLYLLKYKIFSQEHTEEDLKRTLPILSQIPYELKQEAVNLLIDGYNKNNFLKSILVKSVSEKNLFSANINLIDNNIAWKVLFHSFNEDLEVINLIKEQLENEQFPFSFERYELFQHFVHYFRDKTELIPSVENWLKRRLRKFKHIDQEVALASIFIHSNNVKKILLDDLPKSHISHWHVMALLDGWKEDKKIKQKLKEYFRTVSTERTSASAHFIHRVFDKEEKVEAIKILEEILFDRKIIFRERAIISLIEIDKNYFEVKVLKKLINELDTFPKDFWRQYYSAIDTIVRNFHHNKIVRNYILSRVENDNDLYAISIQYFSSLISEDKPLKKSIPLAKEYRLMIIEAFNDLSVLPHNVEKSLSSFETEADEDVMADMAICLFNKIKYDADKIIELCKPLVFARGFEYEVKRSIALAGFLIAEKLDEYFEVKESVDDEEVESVLLDILFQYAHRSTFSRILIHSIIDNFDYLITFNDNSFGSIIKTAAIGDVEHIWGFFARHSSKSSPTYNHLMEFITTNAEKITDNSLISFLNRTAPKNSVLKEILLRFINDGEKRNQILAGRLLGSNFVNDRQVYNDLKDIKLTENSGKIVALCTGWHTEPVLKNIFDEIIKNNIEVDDYVAASLKFLFREVEKLETFLNSVFDNNVNIKRYHRYIFIPMIERLKRDEKFSLLIKKLLLSSNSISEKISYYSLLSYVNMIDEDITLWKDNITEFKNDFGYDIVSNKTVRLKDVLHDYY